MNTHHDFTLREHETAMERGSKWLLLAIQGTIRGPAGLIWTEYRMGPEPQPDSWNSRYSRRQIAAIKANNQRIEALRIAPRDPCPRCNTRGDIGCEHRPC